MGGEGGGWRAAFFRAAAPKRNACRGVEDGELDSGREINSGFVLEVPPSDMMPSHCRCEGPGLGLGHGGEGGRRRKRKPQVQGSAQGSAGQRNAPPHSTSPGFGRHDSGLGFAGDAPDSPAERPATALSTDAGSLERIDFAARRDWARTRWKTTRRDLAARNKFEKRSNAQTQALKNVS